MQNNWKASLAAVLKSEGGNDDDPADHGGRTSRGITQREYDAWRRERHQPTLDVWQAPQSDIEAIYHEEYWLPWGDLLPRGVDYIYFDMAVNAGPVRAVILLQRALGVAADGRIGPITRAAIMQAEPYGLIDKFTTAKRNFYIALHQPKFTKGWLNRNTQVRDTAINMVKGTQV
jgi:lysozyme family protein